MPGRYGKQRINFGKLTDSALPRYEFNRTLRNAIGLSATSYSYQEIHGNAYQWDNIAPEVALVILQDAKQQGIDIQKEVSESSIEQYNDKCLQMALEILNSNPNYLLFTQKLALHITGKHHLELTLEHLRLAGIKSVEQFDEVFKKFLFQQKALTKTFPNFSKINDSDDYYQFMVYLANNPLFDKFLKLFTEQLASEFNKGREQSQQIQVPKKLDQQSLLSFFQSIGYDLILKAPGSGPLKKNTLYIEIDHNRLQYTVLDPEGRLITNMLKPDDLDFNIDENTTESELKAHLPRILEITCKKGHTGDIALNNTASLRNKGTRFLVAPESHNLFLTSLPAVDLVKDEAYKFTLYQWLAKGNLPRLKDHIVEGARQRYYHDLESYVTRLKKIEGVNEELLKEMDLIYGLMKEITATIALLEDNFEEKNEELDAKIYSLTKHLKTLKDLYLSTPLFSPGEAHPSTAGNFEDFVKKVVFFSTSDKAVGYIPDNKDHSKMWKVDLVKLINNLVNDRKFVEVRNEIDKNDYSILTDKDFFSIPPAIILREQLKATITTQLKNNVHHYYTSRSYENDKLTTRKAPVSLRGGNLENSLKETRSFAKKMTRLGEYAADGHLLVGQENNIRKHEVRSGTAALLLAGTGVDGTRSATDKFDVAVKFGGMKDVKIMYIVRGKDAFTPQSYSDPLGKNKFSEIAYTHINPNDYIMTILYDKNNVILDVIVGNLNGEIQGLSKESRALIAAGIEFYNTKHNVDLGYRPIIKLPIAIDQKQNHSGQIHQAKSLFDIVTSHKTKSSMTTIQIPDPHLESARIVRSYSNGNKILVMDTLRPQTDLAPSPSGELELPDLPFKVQPGRLETVRQQALVHFNMRHVLTLKNFGGWSRQERQLQESYNRILQPGFMEGDITEQLNDAQNAQEAWLTDVLVPKVQTALMLHISAQLITDYQIDVEQVNEIAQRLYFDISLSNQYSNEVMKRWNEIPLLLNVLDETGVYKSCVLKAEEKMTKLYPTLKKDSHNYELKFKSCLEIEKNKVRKQKLNHIMSQFLDEHLEHFTKEMGLEKKKCYPVGANKDLVFLGPAASGKSTISSQYVSREDRKQFVSLATDDYRGIYMPGTKEFEEKETTQVFIRTQDSAYLISELVDERIQAKNVARPNVIVDGVTYKNAHRLLVEQNNNSVIVCACLDDMGQVVKRSYDRAMQEDSGSADKGRHVNTSSLLDMHKTASLNLIIHCPSNTTIALYNTNIPRGHKPPLIGIIDTHGEKTLTITHEKGSLMNLASFFNKARVNTSAKSDDSLFFTKIKRPEFQIDSLFAVMNHGFKIMMNGDEEKPCLSLMKGIDGRIIMEIIDPVQVKRRIHQNESEKQLLNMLLLYGKHGNLKAVQKMCLLHGQIDPIVDALLDSKLDIESQGIPGNQNSSLI